MGIYAQLLNKEFNEDKLRQTRQNTLRESKHLQHSCLYNKSVQHFDNGLNYTKYWSKFLNKMYVAKFQCSKHQEIELGLKILACPFKRQKVEDEPTQLCPPKQNQRFKLRKNSCCLHSYFFITENVLNA